MLMLRSSGEARGATEAGFAASVAGLWQRHYCNSFKTSCCCWLAWARAEMPVCSRIVNFVSCATAVGMSAAVMVFSADVRFCTWLLMTLLALCRRLMLAPMLPRRAAID